MPIMNCNRAINSFVNSFDRATLTAIKDERALMNAWLGTVTTTDTALRQSLIRSINNRINEVTITARRGLAPSANWNSYQKQLYSILTQRG